MITYAFMGLFAITYALVTLWGVRYFPDKDSFLSKEDAGFLRALWCIIVILVHVPAIFQNPIQDMLGSFAYIGVTFFFLTSGFGLKYSVAHKEGYMKHFWRRRLPGLLVPAAIICVVIIVALTILGSSAYWSFIYNSICWVFVLLVLYVAFWLVYRVIPALFRLSDGRWQDVTICLIVVAFSLIDRFTSFKVTLIWVVEPLGFAYGVIAACHIEKIKRRIGEKWLLKTLILLVLSLALGVAYLKFKYVPVAGDYIIKILLGIAITMLIFQALGRIKVGNRVNRFIGNISYEVFLAHGFVLNMMALVFRKHPDMSGPYICACILATILLAAVVNRLSRLITRKK